MTEKIVLLDPVVPATFEKLHSLLPAGYSLEPATARGDAHLTAIIADADYAIAGQVGVSAAVFAAASRLKLLHKWGVGVDNIDLDAARAHGVKVARTTGSNATPVAEFAVGLITAALRHLAYGHAELKKGIWRGFPLPQDSLTISGKTVGIIGFGAIGQRLARLLAGYECRILYAKRNPLSAEQERAMGVTHAGIPELLAQSDIVSLNCPLTAETAGLIDRRALSTMKRTAVLVNVARGGIVREDDLVWALENRIIHAAAIDVYEVEPLPAWSPLLRLDNLVATPHLAALAADHFAPTVLRMYANFERTSRGEAIPADELVVG